MTSLRTATEVNAPQPHKPRNQTSDIPLGPGGNSFQGGAAGERFLERLAERAGRNDFALRTTVLLAFSPLTTSSLNDLNKHLHTFKPPADKPGWFDVAGVKFFADGVPPNKTGWVSRQYAEGGCGCLTIAGATDKERLADLDTMIDLAHRAGHQIGVHATGDRAIEATARSFVRAQCRNPRPDPRHYVIHADLASPEVLDMLAIHGFGASMQPAIKWTIADLMRQMLGKKWGDYQWPMRSALDAGVRVTSSSDAPVTFPSWRQGVETAVLRESMATGDAHGTEERITRVAYDTLLAVTVAVLVATLASVTLHRTRVGIRLRAMAEDSITAELEGVPVAQLTVVVWAAAGSLASIGAILVGPSRPAAFDPLVFLLLLGLAASLAGRFERVWPTLTTGFVIAFLETYSARFSSISRYRGTIPFVFILVLLLWQRRAEVWDDAR